MAEIASRLAHFQKNAAFVGFIAIVCFVGVLYILSYLSAVVIPLVWAAFFAMPLHSTFSRLEDVLHRRGREVGAFIFRRPGRELLCSRLMFEAAGIDFEGSVGCNRIKVPGGRESREFFDQIYSAWSSCHGQSQMSRRRVHIRSLTAERASDPEHEGGGFPVNRHVE
eukprot:CAMPEP_0176071580 /NCGR_PEP_ID=MMETSP0120_2-20121206/35753_1 /TAXON_ID=160619 /ORGANISM="Kryptoperidinium foliaceum, Strain CCMP 1326" /LENGTH=166 /DNA_ID=CAMNT_0017405239 /DNA_START=16 /DNA_END=513 /DNA_ORIENTATION=+